MSAAALGTVAVLGGTGEEGRGLAVRWSAAGLDVILGSRQASRAEGAAAEVAAISGGQVAGMANTAAAARCAIAVVSTPFSGLDETLRQCAAGLRDKLVVSAVIPLVRDESGLSIADIKEGSAAQRCAALLPESRVGAAFHTVSARLLQELDHSLSEDIPVLANSADDRETVVALAGALGARGVAVGSLSLAPYVEGLVPLLVSINRLHKTRAGVRFTGLLSPEPFVMQD